MNNQDNNQDNNLDIQFPQRRGSRNLRPRGLFREPNGARIVMNLEYNPRDELIVGDGPNAGFNNQNLHAIAHVHELAGQGGNALNNAQDVDPMDVDAEAVEAGEK